MHIEINGGGIASFGTMNDLQEQLNVLIGDSTDILSAFKTVESKTVNLNGGIGNLRDAVENIGQRIRKEEQKLQNVKDALNKTIEFTEHTITTDKHVAEIVRNNQEDFYRMHPWLRPPVPEKDKNMFEQAWEHVKEGFREFGEAFKDLFEGIKDTLKKGWDMLVQFYEEHKKIIDTILAVVGIIGAIAGILASGGLIALVPLLGALGFSVEAAVAISTAIVITATVTTVAANTMQLIDIWFEIDNEWFQGIKTFLTITSTVLNITIAIGKIYNLFGKQKPEVYIREHTSKKVNTLDDAGGRKVINAGEKPEKYTNVDQLSEKQKARIANYTEADGSDVYNKPLYKPETMTPDSQQKIDDLHNILKDTSHSEGVVYRGVDKMALGDYQDLPIDELRGKTITQKAFLSTTSDINYAREKAQQATDVIMHIYVPEGSPGLDISSISTAVNRGLQESEHLFDLNRELLIIGGFKDLNDKLNLIMIMK